MRTVPATFSIDGGPAWAGRVTTTDAGDRFEYDDFTMDAVYVTDAFGSVLPGVVYLHEPDGSLSLEYRTPKPAPAQVDAREAKRAETMLAHLSHYIDPRDDDCVHCAWGRGFADGQDVARAEAEDRDSFG